MLNHNEEPVKKKKALKLNWYNRKSPNINKHYNTIFSHREDSEPLPPTPTHYCQPANCGKGKLFYEFQKELKAAFICTDM